MVGVTGLEWFDSSQAVTATGTADGSPLTGWTAIRPGGGTPNTASVIRDDWRPVLGTVNGKRSVYFDTSTRRLSLGTDNLPVGTANKFWFYSTVIRETRSGDYYPAGYGSNQGSGVAWKMRQGSVPSVDVGNNGYAIGTVAIATTGISIVVEAYRQTGPLSRAWYNGQASASTYDGTRNTSTAKGGGLGFWPEYGGGSQQDLLRFRYGYGEPSDDDLRRLEGWLSWDTGDNGASLAAGHPYKTAAPTVTTGGASTAPDNASQTLASNSPTIAARTFTQPDNATQGSAATSPTIAARATATPVSTSQVSTTTSPTVAARATTAPDSASQASAATSPTLSVMGAVSVDPVAQAQVSASPALTPHAVTAPDSATQGQQATSPALSNVRSTIVPSPASQAQVATQPTLGVAGSVSVNDASQQQSATAPVLSARMSIAPASASQAMAATSSALIARASVAVDSAAQSSAASAPAVSARFTVAPASATQAQTATRPALSARAVLTVASATSGQIASSPVLFFGQRPMPPSSRTVQTARISRVVFSPRPSRLAA